MLAWYPTYGSLDVAAQSRLEWIGPAMIAVAAGGTVASLLMLWVANANQGDLTIAVDQHLEQMDQRPFVASQSLAS
ncbi:hypothetical protein [Nocardioides sambongensis]|uniref:hypothetical protein n=1 Tax=Nocardioides sambongensis TaxID=2589074 RepID=UPI0011260E37|nr:hypothetical protein [Nocardioides sambongensis]